MMTENIVCDPFSNEVMENPLPFHEVPHGCSPEKYHTWLSARLRDAIDVLSIGGEHSRRDRRRAAEPLEMRGGFASPSDPPAIE